MQAEMQENRHAQIDAYEILMVMYLKIHTVFLQFFYSCKSIVDDVQTMICKYKYSDFCCILTADWWEQICLQPAKIFESLIIIN